MGAPVRSSNLDAGAEPTVLRRSGRVLDNDLLRVFVTIIDVGSFTAASRVLNRTQAAVSLQIKRLEDIAQATLLNRLSRGVEPTPEGSVLLDYARRMLALNDEALARLHHGRLEGRVRIGAIHQYATSWLPQLINEFCLLHPDVDFEVHSGLGTTMPSRLGSEFDLVVCFDDGRRADRAPILREALAWYTAPDGDQHLLRPVPLALLPEGSFLRALAIRTLDAHNCAWRLTQVSENSETLKALVAAGRGVSIFKRSTIPAGELMALGTDDGLPALPTVDVVAEVSPRFPLPAAKHFRHFMLERLRASRAIAAEA